jgi:excisionase family DNA binding protein
MQNIEKTMLTATQVAMVLNVHINTVRRWTDIGVLKSYRIGPRGDRRIKKGDIERFVNGVPLQ